MQILLQVMMVQIYTLKLVVKLLEEQYLLNTLQDLTLDNIYHEQYNYWSLTSLINFFKQFKAKIVKAEKINTHGGSLRVFIKKDKNSKIDKSVKNLIEIKSFDELIKTCDQKKEIKLKRSGNEPEGYA